MNRYIFIFEIGWRDPATGRLKPYEYRKKSQMSINDIVTGKQIGRAHV